MWTVSRLAGGEGCLGSRKRQANLLTFSHSHSIHITHSCITLIRHGQLSSDNKKKTNAQPFSSSSSFRSPPPSVPSLLLLFLLGVRPAYLPHGSCCCKCCCLLAPSLYPSHILFPSSTLAQTAEPSHHHRSIPSFSSLFLDLVNKAISHPCVVPSPNTLGC